MASSAWAEQYAFEPVSDTEDGQLTNGVTWDYAPSQTTVDDLLLNVGRQGADIHEASFVFALPPLNEGQNLNDVRLRVNQQGGSISSGLTLEISGALDLDPIAAGGVGRFALPRTNAKVAWNVPATWDSSGQRIAKWAESPDISDILDEILAQPGWDTGNKTAAIFLEVTSATGDNYIQFDDTHGSIVGGNAGIRPVRLVVSESFRDAFWGKELLCRPKPHEMTVNVIPHVNTQAWIEWGTDGFTFPNSTSIVTITGETAHNFVLTGLTADTEYFYRMRFRPATGGSFQLGPTYSFLTLPEIGTEARVCLTTDMHVTNSAALALDEHLAQLESTLTSMSTFLSPQKYHAWVDFGDLVVIRAQRIVFDLEETDQRYREARSYVDRVAHSLPFVFVRGNHEEVNGWDYDGSPNNSAVWSGVSLLKYFPTPLPDEFYSGNPVSFPDIGVPGNYFAFNIGGLRLRALDPFLFSTTRPHNGHGEVGGSLNGWDWEIGQAQYDWLFNDFVSNPSPYSFLAMHHLTTCYTAPGFYYGRGGVEVSKYSVDSRPTYEWGGESDTGTNELPTERPGYIHGAIHDLLANQGNQVVLKGHDHFYGRQSLDNMVYLTLPRPNDTAQQTGNLWGWRFASFYPDTETLFEENSGFVSITIDNASARFEYIQTYPVEGFGTIQDSFTVLPGGATDTPIGFEAPRITQIRNVTPNPARVAPRIEYQLGEDAHVRLVIYDVQGRYVDTLVDEVQPAGRHDARWEIRGRHGRRTPSGVYFAKLLTPERVDSVKMIVLR